MTSVIVDWILGFLESRFGKQDFRIEDGAVVEGFSQDKLFFVYSDDFGSLVPFAQKSKFIFFKYSSANLKKLASFWEQIKKNQDLILCLIDISSMNHFLFKPYTHSLFVTEKNLIKSMKSLMTG